MPLMVNTLTRAVLADSNLGATYTFSPSASVVVDGASQLVQAAASTASAAMSPDAGAKMSEGVKQEAAKQAAMDSTTPANLLLALGGLLLCCMLVSHARFLARLFASFARRQHNKRTKELFWAEEERSLLVGGGDLREGWTLKTGGSKSFNDAASGMSDPFASPFEVETTHQLSSPAPHYRPPPHIRSLLSYLPFSNTLLYAPFSRFSSPFSSPATVPHLYLIFGYIFLVSIAMIWKSDLTGTTKTKGSGSDFARSGMVALAQIPVAVALGVRGNIIGLCVGRGYERLKVYHKIAGRMVFLCSSLHVAFFLHKWAVAGTLVNMTLRPQFLAGTAAWVSLVALAITSLPWLRKAFYGIFEICHVIGMVGLLVGLGLHVPVAVPFCIASVCIYMLSLVCALTKTRLATARLVACQGSDTTCITIPSLTTGWRAGQHVRIRVLGLPIPFSLQAHPFSIASAPDGEGLVLMCKVAGNWTKKVFDMANTDPASRRAEKGSLDGLNATVILEGPYGGLGNAMLPSFSGVLVIAGGSGITQSLSLISDLVNKASSGVVRARVIDLVWVVRNQEIARPLMPALLDLVSRATTLEQRYCVARKVEGHVPAPLALRVTIHLTRCPASSPVTLLPPINPFDDCFGDAKGRQGLLRQPSEAEREKESYLSRQASSSSSSSSFSTSSLSKSGSRSASSLSKISVIAARPDFASTIDKIADEMRGRISRYRTDGSGLCVAACGPSGMLNNVRRAVRLVDDAKRRGIGGIELEEEGFGF